MTGVDMDGTPLGMKDGEIGQEVIRKSSLSPFWLGEEIDKLL